MVTWWSAEATLSQIFLSLHEVFLKTKLWLWKITKVALWVHLHTDSRSLSIANCIQAGGLICLPDPPDWEMGQSLQAGARPVPGAKHLFFPVAVSCVSRPCLLLTDISVLVLQDKKLAIGKGVGERRLRRGQWVRGVPTPLVTFQASRYILPAAAVSVLLSLVHRSLQFFSATTGVVTGGNAAAPLP